MGFFNFLYRHEPRKFNYKPRFYNPEDDDKIISSEKEELGSLIHKQFGKRRTPQKKNNYSLIYGLIVLAIIIYAIMSIKTESIGRMIELFSK